MRIRYLLIIGFYKFGTVSIVCCIANLNLNDRCAGIRICSNPEPWITTGQFGLINCDGFVFPEQTNTLIVVNIETDLTSCLTNNCTLLLVLLNLFCTFLLNNSNFAHQKLLPDHVLLIMSEK